jgi:Fe2+ or Zn2+ uptake regulation protein
MGAPTSPTQSGTDYAPVVRGAGLRVTATRLAVLRALADTPHASADTLSGAVRGQLGSVSPQTIYSVLGAFVDVGLVRRIEPPGSPALYELRVGDNHHHIVCRSCAVTVDVDCVVGERPCLAPSDTFGFAIDEAEVTFWGLCPSCQNAPSRTDDSELSDVMSISNAQFLTKK